VRKKKWRERSGCYDGKHSRKLHVKGEVEKTQVAEVREGA